MADIKKDEPAKADAVKPNEDCLGTFEFMGYPMIISSTQVQCKDITLEIKWLAPTVFCCQDRELTPNPPTFSERADKKDEPFIRYFIKKDSGEFISLRCQTPLIRLGEARRVKRSPNTTCLDYQYACPEALSIFKRGSDLWWNNVRLGRVKRVSSVCWSGSLSFTDQVAYFVVDETRGVSGRDKSVPLRCVIRHSPRCGRYVVDRPVGKRIRIGTGNNFIQPLASGFHWVYLNMNDGRFHTVRCRKPLDTAVQVEKEGDQPYHGVYLLEMGDGKVVVRKHQVGVNVVEMDRGPEFNEMYELMDIGPNAYEVELVEDDGKDGDETNDMLHEYWIFDGKDRFYRFEYQYDDGFLFLDKDRVIWEDVLTKAIK